MSQSATTHPGPPRWIASTASRRRWKWPPWWTLYRTVSHRSPSVGSVCSSGQPARGCTCPQHTPQPRRGSLSRAFFFHLSWTWQLLFWGFFCAALRGQLSSTSGLITASNPGFLDVCWESSGAAQVVKSASICLSSDAEQTLVSSSPPPL